MVAELRIEAAMVAQVPVTKHSRKGTLTEDEVRLSARAEPGRHLPRQIPLMAALLIAKTSTILGRNVTTLKKPTPLPASAGKRRWRAAADLAAAVHQCAIERVRTPSSWDIANSLEKQTCSEIGNLAAVHSAAVTVLGCPHCSVGLLEDKLNLQQKRLGELNGKWRDEIDEL
jgi:hypothetical protein